MQHFPVGSFIVWVVPLAVALSGCNHNDTPTLGAVSKLKPAKSHNGLTESGSKLNCELKNGPTGCVDEEALAAEARRKSNMRATQSGGQNSQTISNTASGVIQFAPHMCKSMLEGGTGFFAFYGTLLTGQLGNLTKYCNDREAQRSQPPTVSEGANIDKSGTWWCETADGLSGRYGTYRARENPEMNPDTRRRVGD